MLTYPIATVAAVLLGGSNAMANEAGARNRDDKPRHHHARNLPEADRRTFEKELHGNSERSAALRDKFLAASTFVGGRRLEDGEADGGEAGDDGLASYYGFDPSGYALSYHRCAAVKQYDQGVYGEDFMTKKFAILRFCPVDTCDAQSDGNGDGRRLGDKVYGARGGGCKKNYGEYMIEIEDYLRLMVEHREERAAQYCQYCVNFMTNMYMESYGNDDGNNRRELVFEEFKKRDLTADDDVVNTNVCSQYKNFCYQNDDDDNGNGGDGLEEYLECVQSGDVYVGPHCAEDGFTITLGVFADEYCSEYVGDDVSDYVEIGGDDDVGDGDAEVYDLTNYYNSKHGSLDALYEGQESSMCIPCVEQDIYDDSGNNDDDGEYAGVSTVCTQLFKNSARCSRKMKSFNKKSLTAAQWKEMKLSCSYIESVEMGNYDEAGNVNFRWTWGLWGNGDRNCDGGDGDGCGEEGEGAYSSSRYQRVGTSVSPLQAFLLVITASACAILAAWSKTLHTSLTTKESPWAPRREWSVRGMFERQGGTREPQPDGIVPADSGIGASRVRSEGTTGTAYYLS